MASATQVPNEIELDFDQALSRSAAPTLLPFSTSVTGQRLPVYDSGMKRLATSLRSFSVLLFATLILQGCNPFNTFCGSARPAPAIATLSATSITFEQVQQGFPLTVNGSNFVAASVVIINGVTLPTQVVSSRQAQVTITTSLISAPGTASVTVYTSGGNSGQIGCSSGGTSQSLTLTITQ